MKPSTILSILTGAALLLSASLSFAAENKATTETKPIGNSAAAQKSATAKAAKPAAKVKLVDINSASKAELKNLPGIGDAEADKIIAGRPYLSKAHLLTRNVVAPGTFTTIRGLVIAKQNKATEAKLKELQKSR